MGIIYNSFIIHFVYSNIIYKFPACRKPRYIRINTLITSIDEAITLFEEEGWELLCWNGENTYKNFLEQVSSLSGNLFLKDFHVPDLLVFPSGTEFYNHPGYKKGAIILQDKASCLPVHVLAPSMGSVILDMCAAPGMKTTQLAALLQNNGIVYAVERDSKRFEVLKQMVDVSGSTCVKVMNQDVLYCSESDFSNVEYILVDPSCSGSGIADRLDLNPSKDTLRLQKLAGFQIKILRSALTRYPNVKKVIYSTCSLYPEENEEVVRQVLESSNQFKLIPAESVVKKGWINFGSPIYGNIGKYCLYSRSDVDLTNGFFLAAFERLDEGEFNEFYNRKVVNYTRNTDRKQVRKAKVNKSAVTSNNLIDYSYKNEADTNICNNDDKAIATKKGKRKKPSGATILNSQVTEKVMDESGPNLENDNGDSILKKKKIKHRTEIRSKDVKKNKERIIGKNSMNLQLVSR